MVTEEANVIETSEGEFINALQQEQDKWIVDVRSKDDYHDYHLPQAINIDILSPYAVDGLTLLRNEKPVFLYCNSGIRSKSSIPLFKQMGFKKIYHLTKGINSCKTLG